MDEERPNPFGSVRGGASEGTGPGAPVKLLATVSLLLAGLVAAGCAQEEEPATESQVSDTSEAGGDDPSSTSAEESPDPTECEEQRHLVFFSFNEVLTEPGGLMRWLQEETYQLLPRAGARELVTAYHERGFEVVIISRGGPEILIRGVPYKEAMESWLVANGFPLDQRSTVMLEAHAPQLLNEMIKVTASGGSTNAAYIHDPALIPAFLSGGVPREWIHIVGDRTGIDGTQPVPEGGLVELESRLNEVEPVCRVG